MNNDKPDERMATTITKEEISAMVDGEISEFALRRILKESESNPMHALQWEKYQVISSVLKGDIEPIPFRDISSNVMQAIQKDKSAALAAPNNALQNSNAQKSNTHSGEVLPFKTVKNAKSNTKKPHASPSAGPSQRQIGFGLAASCAIAFFGWQYMATQQPPSFAQAEDPATQSIHSIATTHGDTQPSTPSLTDRAKKITNDQAVYRYASTQNNGTLEKDALTQNDDYEPGTKMERINGKEVLWINDFDLDQDSELARTSNQYWMLHHGSQGFKASSTGAMPYSRMINWQISQTSQDAYRQAPVTPVQSNEIHSSPVIVR
jgi:Anti sigma-E protein RseA, N-terminal domain